MHDLTMVRSRHLWWGLLAVGTCTALLVAVFVFHSPPPVGLQPDSVRVVSVPAVGGHASGRNVSAGLVDRGPARSDWIGSDRTVILRALALPVDARLREVIGSNSRHQVICGQVQPGAGQAFRRFFYAKTARMGAIADGGAEFDQTFAELCVEAK